MDQKTEKWHSRFYPYKMRMEHRGAKGKYEMDIQCPCGCIRFHLKAVPINREGEEQ